MRNCFLKNFPISLFGIYNWISSQGHESVKNAFLKFGGKWQAMGGLTLISPTIIGGKYTLNDTLKPGADASILFTDEPPQDKLREFYQNILSSTDKTDLSICIEDFNAVKKPFRSMVLKTAIDGKLSNEIENVIRYNEPLLLVFGNEDNIVNTKYLKAASLPLWNNVTNKLDDAGHFVMLDQAEAFNILLADYCKQIF